MIVWTPKYLLNFFGLTLMIVRIVLSDPRNLMSRQELSDLENSIESSVFYAGCCSNL